MTRRCGCEIHLCVGVFVHVDGRAPLREYINKKEEHFLITVCFCELDFNPSRIVKFVLVTSQIDNLESVSQ